MTRRSAGFVSKRPHRKSRGGCTICKRKKVKCDEGLPECSYCALRNLDCTYSSGSRTKSYSPFDSDSSITSVYSTPSELAQHQQFQALVDPLSSPVWLVPVVETASGSLTRSDLELLDLYKTNTWQTLSVRDEKVIHDLNRDWIPRKAMSHSYLLYAILSITAAHNNALRPSAQLVKMSDDYRHKTLTAYNRALENITNDNYETILITSLFMQVMVPTPVLPCTDTEMLTWVSTFLSMTQGLRILAGLKWACGLEELDIFPVFRRELWTLPPPPDINIPPEEYLFPAAGPLGSTPEFPDPPAMYSHGAKIPAPSSPRTSGMDMSNLPFRPTPLMMADPTHTPPSWRTPHSWQLPAPAFLPPPLMTLLRSIAAPNITGPIDLHRSTLLPVIHALSPAFLSLYHYHLTADFYVRVIVFPTFLPPEFISLVREREPRALVVMAWWFAFVRLIPNMWWVMGVLPRVLHAINNEVFRSFDKVLVEAVDGAYRVVRTAERQGRPEGAKSVFHEWDGVYWHAGGKGKKGENGVEELMEESLH